MAVVKKTMSVCPICYTDLNAKIVEKDGKIFMLKTCPKHGNFKITLSENKYFYIQKYIKNKTRKQSYREVHLSLTQRCNLDCPVCYVKVHEFDRSILSYYQLEKALKKINKNTTVALFGGEPTLREDLPDIIRKCKGRNTALFTNGIKIANFNYAKKLKKAGLNLVHLQFDGFNDNIYLLLRGKRLLDTKIRALENLKKLNISTVLSMIVLKNKSNKEILKTFHYAFKNKFIKAVSLRPYNYFGRLSSTYSIKAEDIMEIIEEVTGGKISKDDLMFLNLYLGYLSRFMPINKCLNDNYLLMRRNSKFESGIKINSNKVNLRNISLLNFLKYYLNINNILLFFSIVPSFIKTKIFHRDLLLELPSNYFIVGIGERCDPYNFDYDITKLCPNFEYVHEKDKLVSVAFNNINREKNC